MATLFSDGFESGGFSNFTGTINSGTGTSSVQTTTYHAGSNAAKFTTTTGSSGDTSYAYKDISWPGSNFVYYECWIYLGSDYTVSLSNGHGLLKSVVGYQSPFDNRIGIYTNVGGYYHVEYLRSSDNGSVFGTATPSFTTQTWTKLALSVDYSGANPTFKWWVNDSLQETIVDTSGGTHFEKPDIVSVGTYIWNWDNNNKGSVYVDEVTVYDQLPSGG